MEIFPDPLKYSEIKPQYKKGYIKEQIITGLYHS
jgi:hypothetical protein